MKSLMGLPVVETDDLPPLDGVRFGPPLIAPLRHDPEIYWLYPACYAELPISYEVFVHSGLDLTHERHGLDVCVRKAAHGAGWQRFVVQWQEYNDDDRRMHIVRATGYECPLFERISVYRAPPHLRELHLRPQGADVIDLPLRRLVYHGRQERGALYENMLYVVEA